MSNWQQELTEQGYCVIKVLSEKEVEYGFKIEKAIADRAIPIVIGYANGNLGYICTAESHKYGGYEPSMSPLLPEAEPLILAELGHLADPPMTKDAIAGRIRRLLAMADKKAEELGIPGTDAFLPDDVD